MMATYLRRAKIAPDLVICSTAMRQLADSDSVNLGSNPGPPASYHVLDIGYIIVFLGSLFSRVFAVVTGLASKAIRGRDGITRHFGCGRYENLSGAISWLARRGDIHFLSSVNRMV
jgi:hypothetical protein